MAPGRPRSPDREKAIIDATLHLLAAVGYEGMSLEAVAARAGASKNTIYRRWPGKQELVVDAVDCYMGNRPWQVEQTSSLEGDLRAHARQVMTNTRGWDGGLVLRLLQARVSHPALFDDLARRRPSAVRLPAEVIDRAVARGELDTHIDPGLFEEIAGAMILFRLFNDQPLDEAFLDKLVDVVLLPAFIRAAAHTPS